MNQKTSLLRIQPFNISTSQANITKRNTSAPLGCCSYFYTRLQNILSIICRQRSFPGCCTLCVKQSAYQSYFCSVTAFIPATFLFLFWMSSWHS